jgi:predicted porin
MVSDDFGLPGGLLEDEVHKPYFGLLVRASLAMLLYGGVNSVVAQTVSPPNTPGAGDDGLSWHGITLYGIIDAGIQYDTHGAPISDYYQAGSGDIVQKNSNGSVFGVTPNNVSFSSIGLRGYEPLHFLDWAGVFKLETIFNPQSAALSDALKSLTQNNGRPLAAQNTNLDASIAGQAFQQAFVGLSSATFGTITFGRQNSVLADDVDRYDPQAASQAFSVVGLSGTSAGGGNTQDRRFDESVKYEVKYADLLHFALQYKFQNGSSQSYATAGSSEAFNAVEASVGATYAGVSVDSFYTKVKDAVAASALTADQLRALVGTNYSLNNSLSGTISDNASYGAMASYIVGPATLYGAYQHITYMNPSIRLAPGFDDIGGYVLASVDNTAYAKADRILQVYWAGAKYLVTKQFYTVIAYYGYKQNAYATGINLNCSTAISAACSGHLDAASIMGDYHFTKRLDSYGGVTWSNVSHGLANGYLNTTNLNPTIGLRFSF